MRKTILFILFSLLFLVPGTLLAKNLDFYSIFPNLTLGFDPTGDNTDTARAVCAGLTATQQKVEIRVITDNANPDDYLMGVQVDAYITVDCQGVCLDTTLDSLFAGTPVANWGIRSFKKIINPDPCVWPDTVRIAAVELDTLDPGAPLGGPGNHHFATLRFNLSEPCNICCDIQPYCNDNCDPTIFVTTLGNGYGPVVQGDCCGPAVPTLSEWGLILFGLTLLLGIVWYVRRTKVAITG